MLFLASDESSFCTGGVYMVAVVAPPDPDERLCALSLWERELWEPSGYACYSGISGFAPSGKSTLKAASICPTSK